jgi:hypothetical protein
MIECAFASSTFLPLLSARPEWPHCAGGKAMPHGAVFRSAR